VYLLLGAAFALAVGIVLAWPVQASVTAGLPIWAAVPLAALVVIGPIAAVGTLGAVRTVEGVAVSALLTGEPADPPAPSATWRQRARTSALLVLHVLAGGVAGTLLVVGLPSAVLVAAGSDGAESLLGVRLPDRGAQLAVAAALLVAVAVGGPLLGRAMAALAPRLLAGSTAERLAAAEESVSVLAGRDRLARELHDSVGHSLSLTSVQAGAARRLLTRDPAAAEQAIRAVEEAARRAMVDLDHVLGLLRDDAGPGDSAPAPDLGDLDQLVGTARDAGAVVDLVVTGAPGTLPAVVSREAYRIVQEGLTNVLRHAPGAACRLEVDAAGRDLELRLTNTAPGGLTGAPGGGRGLVGLRERVRDLRGRVQTGLDDDGRWRLVVRLPVHARGPTA
jgi:signal transduction histidine kinase